MLHNDTDPTLMRPPRQRAATAPTDGPEAAPPSPAPTTTPLSPALARFGHACFVALDSALSRHQLSMLEWQAMNAILVLGEPTIALISRRLYRSPSQATVLLNRLASRGWVREIEARPSRYALTERSMEVLPYPPSLSTALEQRVNHVLSEEQQAALSQLLWKVLEA